MNSRLSDGMRAGAPAAVGAALANRKRPAIRRRIERVKKGEPVLLDIVTQQR